MCTLKVRKGENLKRIVSGNKLLRTVGKFDTFSTFRKRREEKVLPTE